VTCVIFRRRNPCRKNDPNAKRRGKLNAKRWGKLNAKRLGKNDFNQFYVADSTAG
jgi:hypothetical protein